MKNIDIVSIAKFELSKWKYRGWYSEITGCYLIPSVEIDRGLDYYDSVLTFYVRISLVFLHHRFSMKFTKAVPK